MSFKIVRRFCMAFMAITLLASVLGTGLVSDTVLASSNPQNSAAQTTTDQINVTANISNVQSNAGKNTNLGPINFRLYPGTQNSGTPTQITQSNSVCIGNGNGCKTDTATLSAQFSNMNPGTYTICSPDLNANCTTVQDTGNSPTATLSGTAKSSAYNNNDSTNNGSGGTTGTTADCESSGGPFGWLICHAGEYMADAEKSIESYVNSLLKTQPLNFSCTQETASCTKANSNNSYSAKVYSVWSNFRIYGDIVLVLALIAIVFGEAVGGGVVDAYTARKMLPRILVAAILLNLSIYLVAIMEDIFNVLGGGVATLIEAPFKTGMSVNTFSIKLAGGSGLIGFFALTAGAVYAGISIGTVGILIAVVGLGLLAAIGILITLMLRQIIIVLLLIFAPVAFALYCLPNTEQYFKKWWGTLIKTLMVYPIVAVVFAASQIAGTIMSNFGIKTTGNILAQLMAYIAMIIPLFLIPFAFKMSGGIIGNIAGSVANLSHRAKSPINEALKKRAADRWSRAQGNTLWNSNRSGLGGRIARRANSMASWASAPGSNLAYVGYKHNIPGLSGAGGKVESKIHHARMEQSANLVKEMNEIGMFNDKAYRALSGAHEGFSAHTQAALHQAGLFGKVPTSMQDIHRMTEILAESDNATERIGANALDSYRGRLGSLYSDPEMGKASVQAAAIMGLSSHGFASGKDLAHVANDLAEHGKDVEFAHSVVSRAQVMGQQQRPDIKAGYGVDFRDGHFISGVEEGDRAIALIKTISSHDLAAAKGGAIETLRPTIEKVINGEALREQEAKTQAILNSNASHEDKAKARAALDRARGDIRAVKDQLFQWAGPYSQASVDVKSQSLDIIDKLSGGKQQMRRPRRDDNGNVMHDPYTGQELFDTYEAFSPGSLGAEFEQTLRTGRSPDELEAMQRFDVNPDEAAGTMPEQH